MNSLTEFVLIDSVGTLEFLEGISLGADTFAKIQFTELVRKDRPPGVIVLAAWQRAQAVGVVGRRRVGWLEATLGFPA